MATVTVALLAQELLLWIGKTQYFDAAKMVPLATVSGLVLVIYFVLSMTFLVSDNTKPLLIVFILYASSLVGINALLIKLIGVWGALWETFLAVFVRSLSAYLLGEYRSPIDLPLIRIIVISAPAFLLAPLGMWHGGGLVGPRN